tara:strand:- start:1092 stop:1331 length:240 start_codon:yes stop_codon:yes gene_type:complete
MKKRNYRKEYDDYHGTPEQKKRRVGRNAARRYAIRQGRVRKGDGKEVDHKDFNTTNNSPNNLRIMSKSANRSKQPKRKG